MKNQRYMAGKILRTAYVLLLALGLASCETEIIKPAVSDPANYISDFNGGSLFNGMWNYMDHNYAFWAEDPTDWDQVYKKYYPLCSKLDLTNPADVRTMMAYWREATDNMIDGHLSITVNYTKYAGLALLGSDGRPTFAYDAINGYEFPKAILQPAATRRLRLGTYEPEKFSVDSLIKFNYFDKNTLREYNQPIIHAVSSLTADRQILYLYFSEFALTNFASSYSVTLLGQVMTNFFAYAKDAKKLGLKGIIIDLRGNGGGYIDDLNYLAGRLVSQPVTFGYNRYKNGDNRKDYTPWLPAVLQPNPQGSFAVDVPIVMLVDQNSVSMSEITTFVMKAAYPQTTKVVGRTTWGGHGGLTANYFFNAGIGYLGDDITFYTPVTAFKFIDGIMREGKGITPDVDVKLDPDKYKNRIDTQFEAAVQVLK